MSPRAREAGSLADRCTDSELVRRCAKGDSSAWNTLVQRYRQLVYAIPLRMGLDASDADDVFQTTFERLVEKMGTLEDPSRVRAWLVTTARRSALAVRRRAPDAPDRIPENGPEPVDPQALPSEELERLQDRALVQQALSQIDARCRELLRGLYGSQRVPEGESYEVVARALRMPLGSVGPTRLRCLRKLLEEFRRLSEPQ